MCRRYTQGQHHQKQQQGISLFLAAWLVLTSQAAGPCWPLLSVLLEAPCQQRMGPAKCKPWKAVPSLGRSSSQHWRRLGTCNTTLQIPSSLVWAGEEGSGGDVLCVLLPTLKVLDSLFVLCSHEQALAKAQSRIPLSFPPPSHITPLSRLCPVRSTSSTTDATELENIFFSKLWANPRLSIRRNYPSGLLSANAIGTNEQMNEWMSKYLMKHARVFVSFPGLSHSVLLIYSKVKPLFVWSGMGEERELFCLMITTFSTRDL